ncbi:LysE family transporter [Thermaerobacillus caldiproteolyticus]|uniref:LysE family transporter n=1 Tax=Thermaerobacillus caldiproteolyticus TaxID=247480 RepID=UPI00188B7CDA|nr:LysE family transporter [Anoxybacillus caldiproteolyticus]QPA32134.1 LysE family transporter [Anoxybacillus caldiproteolyticus]
MNIETWLTVLSVGILIVLSPGPQWAITIKTSLSSRECGFYTVLGMCTGSIAHITYCLLGIGVIISQSILLFNVVKWIGAVYLIYLGLKSLFTKKQQNDFLDKINNVSNQLTRWKSYRTGMLTSLLNPKATLFYLSLFTQVIQPGTSIFAQLFYGFSVVEIEMIWYSLMVIFLSHNYIRKRFMAISTWVERISGAILVLLGIRLAISKPNS